MLNQNCTGAAMATEPLLRAAAYLWSRNTPLKADLNGLQWERIKTTRFLPPGIPGTRPGGNSLLFQSGSHDNRAPCKEAGVGRLILIKRNYIAEMLNDGIRTQIGKGHF